ncbi:protein disabled [Cylas formicarius]|uniref:protein disabled n=1 Tax=Cylas formicarius TaxID=197179 RepID=UPI002958B4F3|nr:protein disabled [Cylas formicarius]
MQTLRKKTSPLKYKNETTKFLGDGVSFKAKLIGILEVSEARGDRMCQEALSDLKMAIRAAGEHKQRITVNIAIDGLRLRDEKTGDCLYHHPVHKISFIAQDMTDSRAFGYIFGSPDTGHRFFGIKTDKAASQVVIAMRDLFQVVFSLKKKEIELAKQHLEKTYLPSSPLFSDPTGSGTKIIEKSKVGLKGPSTAPEPKGSGAAVADLVDLELELSNLQQGLNQMEKITPSNPYGSKDDPFGDSFVYYPVNKLILPPPPSSGRERSSRMSDVTSIFSPKTPHIPRNLETGGDTFRELSEAFPFSQELSGSQDQTLSADWFSGSEKFNEPVSIPEVLKEDKIRDEKHEMTKREILSQFDVFTELDPLGTGRSKPYIDKKYFFQELKNPPKKVLNDLVSSGNNQDLFVSEGGTVRNPYSNTANVFANDPFGDDPFVKNDPFADSDFTRQEPFNADFVNFTPTLTSNWEKNESLTKSPKLSASPKMLGTTFDTFNETKLSTLTNLDISSGSESTPEPPPRPISTLTEVRPPPLPPKKQSDILIKPPPRPPHTEDAGVYDLAQDAPSISQEKGPPLPAPLRKSKIEPEFGNQPERPHKKLNVTSSDEDYLTPISFPERLPPPQRSPRGGRSPPRSIPAADGLDITLSKLTLSDLNELATKLSIPSNQLSNMPLMQLASYISNFIKTKSVQQDITGTSSEEKFATFDADFSNNFSGNASYDKYAVFRELQEEIQQGKPEEEPRKETDDKFEDSIDKEIESESVDVKPDDKYAALREIVDKEFEQVGLRREEKTDVTEPENTQASASRVTEEVKVSVEKTKDDPVTPHNEIISKDSVIEYAVDIVEKSKCSTPEKSPSKSPIPMVSKESAGNRLTSGSLSDIVSGSSPEADNTGSNSDIPRKENGTDLGESWAVFDQTGGATSASLKENLCTAHSEEGVSPWSSDSKEFAAGSPTEWRKNPKNERWQEKREQDGWWDTSAEPEVYNPANRRSTDSYEEEYYECYDRPRRRRQGPGWQHVRQPTGGHSSSSRDVSPWEEEPNRREGWPISRTSKGHPFDRHRDMKHADSWDDEDDDYEYDEEHRSGRRYFERSGSKESERHISRDSENARWVANWNADRRYRKRRDGTKESIDPKERWCCVDWKRNERDINLDKSRRYVGSRKPAVDRRERHDERFRDKRESQESPWEDEYFNEPAESHSRHYLPTKRNWKQRPSSASEMERKSGENKSRAYLGAGGSDGEKDRRFKGTRRSRSRDSQYGDGHHRHKPDAASIRSQYRSKQHAHSRTMDADYKESKKFSGQETEKKPPSINKKKTKDSTPGPYPRKGCDRTKSMFVADFEPTKDSPVEWEGEKFGFEVEFEVSETRSTVSKSLKGLKSSTFDNTADETKDKQSTTKEHKVSPRSQPKPRSPFEDDFSPSERASEGNGISSIKEETDIQEEEEEEEEDEDRFSSTTHKVIAQGRKNVRHRLSAARTNANLKKSESVNIFSMEDDPFDDEFFSGNGGERMPSKDSDYGWMENFKEYNSRRK